MKPARGVVSGFLSPRIKAGSPLRARWNAPCTQLGAIPTGGKVDASTSQRSAGAPAPRTRRHAIRCSASLSAGRDSRALVLFPRDAIVDLVSARGTPDLLDSIKVMHVSGGVSVIGLKSYQRGRESFQGETLDYLWFDEEPPADIFTGSSAITVLGTASTSYIQNLTFHRYAFALAVVPMERPAGAVDVARKSYKGLSVRVVPYYDGTNDISNYRLDTLFGVKMLDGRLATRLSGSP
jgi:phage terminase large subunit-like protein